MDQRPTYEALENQINGLQIDDVVTGSAKRPVKGATCTIYRPAARRQTAPGAFTPARFPSGTERILLVDDESPVAEISTKILEHLGYSVTSHTCSLEALELFRANPDAFDLVITDMAMPNLTGDEFAVELMRIRQDIPIILCTGYSKKCSAETALEIGFKAFAYKPMAVADLARMVRKVLDEAKG